MRGLVRLSTETDRVYTINLGKVLLSPNNRRAKRAINMIREFARHHMGISEVKIDMDVSHIIWSKGIRSPPRKIRVRMRKTEYFVDERAITACFVFFMIRIFLADVLCAPIFTRRFPTYF